MLTIATIHPLTAGFATAAQDETTEFLSRPVRRRSLAQRLARPVAVWFRRRALTARLESLDDHLLADIGLVRADIPATVARAHPWTPKPKYLSATPAVRTAVTFPAAPSDAVANDAGADIRAA